MQGYFYTLADRINGLLQGNEVYTTSFAAEESDFVRFNRSAVRHAGCVTQRGLSIDLINGRKHSGGHVSLSGDAEEDLSRIGRLLAMLREQITFLPDDPYLLYSTTGPSTEKRHRGKLPDANGALAEIQRAGRGRDLVGFYAAGPTYAGFANSFGQRNWHESESFSFDWSFYHETDKAVKASYAGFEWKPQELERIVRRTTEQVVMIAKPARTIDPGSHRVYLAPTALDELIGLLSWGGFSLRAHRNKATPLLRMISEGARLDPRIDVCENTGEGIAPNFGSAGFLRPERVSLIEHGVYRDCLVSARSAAEFGAPTNGASAGEAPESVEVGAGDVSADQVLGVLHTGIYVSNLWYLNFSDRNACRMTGMTRFATFWVQNGVVQAPIRVMRFDETLYRMFGEKLVGLTREREFLLDPGTYGQRSTRSARLPGAIIDDFTFTL